MASSTDPDDRASLAAVAAAARRVNRAVRVTDVGPETLAAVTEALERVADELEASVHEGPHCQTGHRSGEGLDASSQPHEYFPYSPIVGQLNPISPPVRLEVGEDLVVRGEVTLNENFNGPPWNLTHGGVIAAIFDELLGVATIVGAGGGYTGRLTVHYRKPTPVLQPLELVGWLDSKSGRKLVARGEVRHEGQVTAEADGLFVQLGNVLGGDATGDTGEGAGEGADDRAEAAP